MIFSFVTLAIVSFVLRDAFAFDNSRSDNVAVYWGQNSYAAAHNSTSNGQKTLAYYCNDNAIDVFPIAFLTSFFSAGGLPSLNLADACNPTNNATFPGTNLLNCAALAHDITYCQSKGKIITISLGGATGSVGFSSDSQAHQFAHTIWNLFLGGISSTRPFGKAVLDGVDLDVEGGNSSYYPTFVKTVRSLASGAKKKYYITAAPQCSYPDATLGSVLNAAHFDAVYVQFYNNPCGLQAFTSPSGWNFGLWDNWARTISPNPNVKVYIGAPASTSAAEDGFVDTATLQNIATTMRKSFPSFGGVMLWDASQAWANNRYHLSVKKALVATGNTSFTYPACSAPAFVSGTAYTKGSKVSHGGYIWEAKWSSSATPATNANSDWRPIAACGGPPPSKTSSTGSPTNTVTTTGPAGTSTPGCNPSHCTGIFPWSLNVAYVGNSSVIYNGHLWKAQWWSYNDIPGGDAGVWIKQGACS